MDIHQFSKKHFFGFEKPQNGYLQDNLKPIFFLSYHYSYTYSILYFSTVCERLKDKPEIVDCKPKFTGRLSDQTSNMIESKNPDNMGEVMKDDRRRFPRFSQVEALYC